MDRSARTPRSRASCPLTRRSTSQSPRGGRDDHAKGGESVAVAQLSPEAPARTERPRGYNLLTATVGAAIGFLFGALLGGAIGSRYDFVAGSDQNDIGALLGYFFAVVGWLAGLGFLNHP